MIALGNALNVFKETVLLIIHVQRALQEDRMIVHLAIQALFCILIPEVNASTCVLLAIGETPQQINANHAIPALQGPAIPVRLAQHMEQIIAVRATQDIFYIPSVEVNAFLHAQTVFMGTLLQIRANLAMTIICVCYALMEAFCNQIAINLVSPPVQVVIGEMQLQISA